MAPGTTTEGPKSPPMASIASLGFLLFIGGSYGLDLAAVVLAAGGAYAMGLGGSAARAVDDSRLGNTVMGTTHALSGMGLFVLLNGHDILLRW